MAFLVKSIKMARLGDKRRAGASYWGFSGAYNKKHQKTYNQNSLYEPNYFAETRCFLFFSEGFVVFDDVLIKKLIFQHLYHTNCF